MGELVPMGKASFAREVCDKCIEQDECASSGGTFLNMDKCIEVEKVKLLAVIAKEIRDNNTIAYK